MKDIAENTFLNGIVNSRSELDSLPTELTDAVNATVLSDGGDQATQQSMKSNVPVTHVTGSYSEETITRISLSGSLVPALNKKLNSLYFYHTGNIWGLGTYIQFTYYYSDSSNETDDRPLSDSFPGEEVLLNVDTKKTLIAWEYEVIFVGTTEEIRYTQPQSGGDPIVYLGFKAVYYASGNVGLPTNRKVLGVKNYNNVAYFLSGVKSKIQESVEAVNNYGLTPYQDSLLDLSCPDPLDGRDNPSTDEFVPVIVSPSKGQYTFYRESKNKFLFTPLSQALSLGNWGSPKIVSLTTIPTTGIYTFEFDFVSMLMAVSGKIQKHRARFSFRVGGVELYSVTLDKKSPQLLDSLQKQFEAKENDVAELWVDCEAEVKTDFATLSVMGSFEVAESPVTARVVDKLEVSDPIVTNASSNLSRDGSFSLALTSSLNTSNYPRITEIYHSYDPMSIYDEVNLIYYPRLQLTWKSTGATQYRIQYFFGESWYDLDPVVTNTISLTAWLRGKLDSDFVLHSTFRFRVCGVYGTTDGLWTEYLQQVEVGETLSHGTTIYTLTFTTVTETTVYGNPDNTGYSVAIENCAFVPITGGQAYDSFTDGGVALGAGDYNVYIKKVEGGQTYILKRIVAIGYDENIPDLQIQANILDFTTLGEDFKLQISVIDNAAYENLALVKYKFGYKIGDTWTYSNEVNTSSVVFNITGITEDTFIECAIWESANHPSAETAYKREAHVLIPVTQHLEDRMYNLEVGTFPSPDYENTTLTGSLDQKYRPLNNLNGGPFLSKKLFLSGKYYPDIELQPSFDGTVNVIFTEPCQSPRIINSGFSVLPGGKYKIIDRNNTKDSNRYNDTTVDRATRLLLQPGLIPVLSLQKINNSGGCLPVGMYKFFIKFGTVDENETDFVEESGDIPIFFGETLGSLRGGKSGEQTSKSIEFEISNIDPVFDHAIVYFQVQSGDVNNETIAYRINKKYLIPDAETSIGTSVVLSITGFEPKEVINIDELSLQQSSVSKVKTIAQLQNRLFAANLQRTQIDYNQLFKVGRQICTLYGTSAGGVKLTNFMGKYPLLTTTSIDALAYNYFNEKLWLNPIPDLNLNRSTYLTNLIEGLVQTQGFCNPLFVEKFAGYWPLETYKYGICFVMDDDSVSNPVPVIGADYKDEALTETLLGTAENRIFSSDDWRFDELSSEVWHTVSGMSYNSIGVTRFPGRPYSNSLFYPKFRFKKSDISSVDPQFFTKVKGFFFVRAERKPDVLMEGLILPCQLVSAENPLFGSDFLADPGLDISSIADKRILSAIPVIEDPNDPEVRLWMAAQELRSAYTSGNLIDTYTSIIDTPGLTNADYVSGSISTSHVYKYWFKSGDMVADMARAAASFNGNRYSMLANSTPLSNILISQRQITIDETPVDYTNHMLQWFIANSSRTDSVTNVYDHVITEFIAALKNTRSGSGFISRIPYKACYTKVTSPSELRYYPTGNFPPYIGLTTTMPITQYIGAIYPNATGPLSKDALKAMYSSDEGTTYIPITPRYSFSDFANTDEIEILGTRGDCFITPNIFNVVRTLPSVQSNPASTKSDYRASTESEYNSYRADEASMNVAATHASNHLSFLRHNEVVDELEAATYGKGRSFLPYLGAGELRLYTDRNHKLPETEAFNKGYKAHFTGRLYSGISSDVPFVSGADENTIMFSAEYNKQSFYNAYRDFTGMNSQNFNKELGSITKIISLDNNLLVVHQHGVTLVGINEQTPIGDSTSGEIMVKGSDVMNSRSKLISQEFGSSWIRSIVTTDNTIYGVDVDNGKIWAIVGGNLQVISAITVNKTLMGFLRDFKNKEEIPGELYVASFFDSASNNVYFTFYNKNSRYTDRPIPMPIDQYYLMLEMAPTENSEDNSLREAWIAQPMVGMDDTTPTDQYVAAQRESILRRRVYERYLVVRNSFPPVNYLTLVYNEDTKTWITRKNYSPEFMFNLSGKLYSLNNEETGLTFGNNNIFNNDLGKKIIWDHNGMHAQIPSCMSFYGQDPVFEVEFIVNKNAYMEKMFATIQLIGNDSPPSEVHYQISEDSPWLKIVRSTKFFLADGWPTWDEIERDYYDRILDQGIPIVHPYSIMKQVIKPRAFNNIMIANYEYKRSNGVINIQKGIKPLYWNDDLQVWNSSANPYNKGVFRDKFIRIRLRYTSGKYTYLKSVLTSFLYVQ